MDDDLEGLRPGKGAWIGLGVAAALLVGGVVAVAVVPSSPPPSPPTPAQPVRSEAELAQIADLASRLRARAYEIDEALRNALASAPAIVVDPELACPETVWRESVALRRGDATQLRSRTAVELREILGRVEWRRTSPSRDLDELASQAEAALASSRETWDVVVLTPRGEAARAYVFDLASGSFVCAGELPHPRAGVRTILWSLRPVEGRPESAEPPVRIEERGPPPAELPAPRGSECERYRECVCTIARSPGATPGFLGACRDAEDLLRRGVTAEPPTCRSGRRLFGGLAEGFGIDVPASCR